MEVGKQELATRLLQGVCVFRVLRYSARTAELPTRLPQKSPPLACTTSQADSLWLLFPSLEEIPSAAHSTKVETWQGKQHAGKRRRWFRAQKWRDFLFPSSK